MTKLNILPNSSLAFVMLEKIQFHPLIALKIGDYCHFNNFHNPVMNHEWMFYAELIITYMYMQYFNGVMTSWADLVLIVTRYWEIRFNKFSIYANILFLIQLNVTIIILCGNTCMLIVSLKF